jgi:PIN domain nuclease of toxin-antitoxin system
VTASVLVDTHLLLWIRAEPERLNSREQDILEIAQLRYVSIVVLWEIAILMSLGRIARQERFLDIPEGFDLLPVQARHCRALLDLPQHHRDPFDRMLIAQAISEHLPLLTRDRAIAGYADAGLTVLSFGGD